MDNNTKKSKSIIESFISMTQEVLVGVFEVLGKNPKLTLILLGVCGFIYAWEYVPGFRDTLASVLGIGIVFFALVLVFKGIFGK